MNEETRLKRLAYTREWRKRNPDKVKAGWRKWYAENKDDPHQKERTSLYRAEKSEQRREQFKNWRKQNVETHKEMQRRWIEENRGRKNAHTAKRDASRRRATPPWLTAEHLAQIEAFYIEAARLTEATGIVHHVDHVFPLKGENCSGLHVPWNLQVLPARENIQKKNRVPELSDAA